MQYLCKLWAFFVSNEFLYALVRKNIFLFHLNRTTKLYLHSAERGEREKCKVCITKLYLRSTRAMSRDGKRNLKALETNGSFAARIVMSSVKSFSFSRALALEKQFSLLHLNLRDFLSFTALSEIVEWNRSSSYCRTHRIAHFHQFLRDLKCCIRNKLSAKAFSPSIFVGEEKQRSRKAETHCRLLFLCSFS